MNSPEHLARFLEGVIAADPGQLSELVYDTLLELYLRDDVSNVIICLFLAYLHLPFLNMNLEHTSDLSILKCLHFPFQ